MAGLGRTGKQAREELIELLTSGVFEPGSKLPPERELADQLAVSRVVLREALNSLAADSYVRNSPRRGWFVTAERMSEKVSLKSFTEMALDRHLTPGSHVITREVRTVSIDEARKLVLAPGSEVLELVRVRTLDGLPACVDKSVVAISRARGLEECGFEDQSLYGLLEETCGVRIVQSDYAVRAGGCSEALAAHLRIKQGDPVLVGEERAKDVLGNPILLGRVVYRADAYEFRATLFRKY